MAKERSKRDDAIADSSKAIEGNPQSAEAYNNRGYAKLKKGDWNGAIADCSKAIQLNSTFADAYSNRGYAKAYDGDQDGGLADYSKAIVLTPKTPIITPPVA